MQKYDAIIIGAGAAGLHCAALAAARKRKILILEHNSAPGRKILLSGGGRCNFTNLDCESSHYQCANPHFVKSALKQFSQWQFIEFVERYNIEYYEKQQGQLFCKDSGKDLLNALLSECQKHQVRFVYNAQNIQVAKFANDFKISSSQGHFVSPNLIIATGGLAYPRVGASDFAYKLARQLNINIISPRPALVPLLYHQKMAKTFADLSGLSLKVQIIIGNKIYTDDLLFTHKGVSGPVVLQASSHLTNHAITINLAPDESIFEFLMNHKNGRKNLVNGLSGILPKKLLDLFLPIYASELCACNIADLNKKQCRLIGDLLNHWQLDFAATAGYGKAEVTAGGIDTAAIDSKTMACKNIQNLYFIGEALSVTGELGGYNFQWAWSSAFCAANAI